MSALRRHIRDVHEKKRHKCDQCEKDFASSSTLHNHKFTKHEGKKIKRNSVLIATILSIQEVITIDICSHISR